MEPISSLIFLIIQVEKEHHLDSIEDFNCLSQFIKPINYLIVVYYFIIIKI